MKRRIFLVLLLLPALLFGMDQKLPDSQLVLMKNDSPLVAFRILFLTGSAHDPKGKEGVAALTASMLAEGSTKTNDYDKILQLLFPMAASYTDQVDEEMTVIRGVTHRDNLMPYYQLLRDAVLAPAFKQEDFDRLKTDQLNFVAKTLRFNNDEELGKEVLSWGLFRNHPFGHPIPGLVSSNSSLTLQDVKDFYGQHYTRNNAVIGVAGNYSDELIAKIKKDFSALPSVKSKAAQLPKPDTIEGLHVIFIEKKTPATAISFGFPISFTRSNDDFYPMMIANAWLGQHRNEFSHLYQVIREARGLNYGDYSYIEHFALGGRFMQPPTNYARHQQIFQVWIRPVPNAVRHFALRQAIRELQTFIENGISEKDFEHTKQFLTNYSANLAQSNSELLGYALDDRFYKLSQPFLERMKAKFTSLKVEDVNVAIKKHLNAKNMIIAIVTQDAESFKKALVKNTPSPIQYESPKPQSILDEDQVIMSYPLPIQEENITIIPADKIFE